MRCSRVVVLFVVVSQLAGCAWLFQDKLAGGYDGYRGRSEPRCSTSNGWAVVDGVFAGLSVVSAIAASGDETDPNAGVYVVSGIAWAIIHGASALSGTRWASDCQRAYADWNADDAPSANDEAERRRLARELAREQQREPAAAPPPEPTREAAPLLRGFFCSGSPAAPAAGLCTRQKVDCQSARAIAIGAVADLTECALVETAFCFDAGSGSDEERCAPSEVACGAQRATVSDGGECVETR